MHEEEGIIKFKCEWIKDRPLPIDRIKDLNARRNELYKAGLIGVNKLPYTGRHIAYGTTAMAGEIKRLFEGKIFAMGGHERGIVSFGKSCSEAGKAIFDRLG